MKHGPAATFNFLGVLVAAILGAAVLPGCAKVDVQALFTQASTAMEEGKWHVAVDLTDKCLRAEPKNVTATIMHGICLFEARRRAESLEALERATALAPDDFFSNYYLGWALCECERYGDAVAPLKKAYEGCDDHPEVTPDVLVLLARCCLEQNLSEGVRYLLQLRKYRAFNRRPEVYNALGIMFLNKGEHENARQSFLLAWEKDEQNAVVLQNLGVLHDYYLREPPEAMRYYRYSLKAKQLSDDSTGQGVIRERLRVLARERARVQDTAPESPGRTEGGAGGPR